MLYFNFSCLILEIIQGLAINVLQLHLQDLDLDTLAAWNFAIFIRSGGGKDGENHVGFLAFQGTCGPDPLKKPGLETGPRRFDGVPLCPRK